MQQSKSGHVRVQAMTVVERVLEGRMRVCIRCINFLKVHIKRSVDAFDLTFRC